jgi:hypothetical protein
LWSEVELNELKLITVFTTLFDKTYADTTVKEIIVINEIIII